MTRREARNAILAGLLLGVIYWEFGPLWTLYVAAVGALYTTCWMRIGEFDRAQDQLAAMRERRKHHRP